MDEGRVVCRRRRCACGVAWVTEERARKNTVRSSPTQASTTYGLPVDQPQPSDNPALGETALIPDLDPISLSGSPDPSKPDLGDPRLDGRGLFERLLAGFCQVWEQAYGVRYSPSGPERKLFGAALQTMGADVVAGLPGAFGRYLRDMAPFVAQEQRHSLKWFIQCAGWNKYRTVAPVLSKREATTVAAGQQWLEMHGVGNGAKR